MPRSAQKIIFVALTKFVEIVIFPCVYWCFERLASPSGRPNGCLETFVGTLGLNGGHFGDMCATYLRHDGSKSASVAPKVTTSCGSWWSMLVHVGRWQSLEASVGPAEGGEASPPSFAEVL